MKKEKIFEMDKQCFLPVFNRYPIVLDHGDGPYVYDNEGNKYLDFLAGIAVNIVGHGHRKLVKAIAAQAGKIIHCSNLYYTENQAVLSQRLVEKSGLSKVFFGNSGAEANEGAIKLARKYAKTIHKDKVQIITAQHSFHGRTLTTLTATAQPKYQEGFDPLPGGFDYVPFNDMAALKNMVSEKTCAVMLEPIQGEGGVCVPDPGYLQEVRELCDKYGALLIFDEIQTGLGRTGTMFGYEHYGVKPDIMSLAKGLGGGVPIGAVLVNEKVASAIKAGDHGSTFGGNPLACAAALAVLDIMEDENLVDNSRQLGEYMLSQLESLKRKYPELIVEVRGKGLMIGMELTVPGRSFVGKALEAGVIINCTADKVLRFVPPLNVKRRHIDEVVDVLARIFSEMKT